MPVRKHEHILVFSINGLPKYFPQGLKEVNQIVTQGGNSENYGERNKKEYIKQYSGCPRDVLEIPSEGKTQHPTQKPVALFEYLIRTYTNEGDIVLDNCAGSFTTAIACENTKRNWICIEKEEEYCEIGRKRLCLLLQKKEYQNFLVIK